MWSRRHRVSTRGFFPAFQVFEECNEAFQPIELMRIDCQKVSRLIVESLVPREQNQSRRVRSFADHVPYHRLHFPDASSLDWTTRHRISAKTLLIAEQNDWSARVNPNDGKTML